MKKILTIAIALVVAVAFAGTGVASSKNITKKGSINVEDKEDFSSEIPSISDSDIRDEGVTKASNLYAKKLKKKKVGNKDTKKEEKRRR